MLWISTHQLASTSVLMTHADAHSSIWSMIVPAEPHSTKQLQLPQKRSLVTAVDNLIWIPYVDEGLRTHASIPRATPR